jgi:hypothetical protein
LIIECLLTILTVDANSYTHQGRKSPGNQSNRHPQLAPGDPSTGGIIAARMPLMQPQRFGRVFALYPVTPLRRVFAEELRAVSLLRA